MLRDWSLITGRGGGGATNRTWGGGGGVNFTPTKKRGGEEKVLAKLKGGEKTFWGGFYAVALSFSHIEGGGGGRKKFSLFKRGDAKGFTLS